MDLAAEASKSARAAEPSTAEAAISAANVELAAYTSGTIAYLAQGSDFEAIDLAQHVCPSMMKCFMA